MARTTNNDPSNKAYIDTGAFNATIIAGLAAGATAFGGATLGIVKAAGARISEPVLIAVLGVVAVALLALAIVVAADVLARSRVKVATIKSDTNEKLAADPALVLSQNGSQTRVELAEGATVSIERATT